MRMIPRFANRYQFKSGQQRILLGSGTLQASMHCFSHVARMTGRFAPEAAVQEKRRCRSLLSHVGGIRLLSYMLTVEHQG